MDILNEQKQSGELEKRVEYFSSKLQEIVKDYSDIFISSVGLGLMLGLRAKDDEIVSKVVKSALKHRVLVLKAGRNTVRFLPPLTITNDEIDLGFERFKKALDEIS